MDFAEFRKRLLHAGYGLSRTRFGYVLEEFTIGINWSGCHKGYQIESLRDIMHGHGPSLYASRAARHKFTVEDVEKMLAKMPREGPWLSSLPSPTTPKGQTP